jgi:alkylation response protein AidB-like acyl-CoA dehydrogenase
MTMDKQTAQELVEVRHTVRCLVDSWLAEGRFTPSCDAWLRRYDMAFTRAMAERRLIGISWPPEYGGAGRSSLARLVVTEELLRAGAPVAAHWIADRQIGPSILEHGSETAKAAYLPGIASGEVTFCLGMSETEAGSDLASVRTTATRTDGGWEITGRKIWTSQAHRSTHAYVLARTSKGASKHEGLTEFLVDMSHPGVEVRPIYDLRGDHHFNEVSFEAVSVADDHVLGEVGAGWQQVTGQLSLERGGVERVLSTYPLLDAALEEPAHVGASAAATGEMLARLATLRAMAFDVASAIDSGRAPVFEAAMLKDLGTVLERDVNEFARGLLDAEADPLAEGVRGLLAHGILAAPGFTIRGGTTEVLRSIIARGLTSGSRTSGAEPSELRAVVNDVLAGHGEDPDDRLHKIWDVVRDLGWSAVGVDEEYGGEGGDLTDVADLVEGLGRHSVSLPVAETILARRAIAAAGKRADDSAEVLTVAVPTTSERVRLTSDEADSLVLRGSVARVPWGQSSAQVVVVAADPAETPVLVLVASDATGVSWTPGRNLAGEPRDTMHLEDVRVPADAVLARGPDADRMWTEAALLRSAAVRGALETALSRTVEHVTTREQFGRPLVKFQTVATLLATLASEHQCAKVALERAVASVAAGDPDAWTRVAAARVITGRAATEGARIAHQLHAAMGVTREHPLHLSTRRLWSWRDELGTQRAWAARLGAWAAGVGSDARWRWITEQQEAGSPGGVEATAAQGDREGRKA